MDNRSDYEHSCPNHGPAYDCGVVQALRERIAELDAVAEAAVALLEPDTDESYPSIDYAKQERCKQLLCLALRAAGYL